MAQDESNWPGRVLLEDRDATHDDKPTRVLLVDRAEQPDANPFEPNRDTAPSSEKVESELVELKQRAEVNRALQEKYLRRLEEISQDYAKAVANVARSVVASHQLPPGVGPSVDYENLSLYDTAFTADRHYLYKELATLSAEYRNWQAEISQREQILAANTPVVRAG